MIRVKYFHGPGKNLLGPWKYLTRIMAVIYSAVGCGNLCTAGSQIFKTKEFTWFSEVNYFECRFESLLKKNQTICMFFPLRNCRDDQKFKISQAKITN
jgi:hypothetical protein